MSGLSVSSPSDLQAFSVRSLCPDKHSHVAADTCEHPETHRAFWLSFHSGTRGCTILTKTGGKEKYINLVTVSPSHLPVPAASSSLCSQCPQLRRLPHIQALLTLSILPVLRRSSARPMDLTLESKNLNREFFLCGRVS